MRIVIKGRIGVAAVVARKGRSDLMLDVMVLEYRVARRAEGGRKTNR